MSVSSGSERHAGFAGRHEVDPFIFQWDETFDVGMDTGTGVAILEYRYDVPFRLTGKLDKLTFNLEPQQLTAEERRGLQAMGQRNNRASE